MSCDFSEISGRSNLIYRRANDNDVVIYEDHRAILNVLFHLYEAKKITGALDLIMLDNHDDFLTPSPRALTKLRRLANKKTRVKLLELVEFDLRSSDDDWVKAGMELGLIGNVFLFNCTIPLRSGSQSYKTRHFGTKYMYYMGPIWDALDKSGILLDDRKPEFKALAEHLGWKKQSGTFQFVDDRAQFMFDIDLDCFSVDVFGKRAAASYDQLNRLLRKQPGYQYQSYPSVDLFIKDLMRRSAVVTMCFENTYCGGMREAFKIFHAVDQILFGGLLGE